MIGLECNSIGRDVFIEYWCSSADLDLLGDIVVGVGTVGCLQDGTAAANHTPIQAELIVCLIMKGLLTTNAN